MFGCECFSVLSWYSPLSYTQKSALLAFNNSNILICEFSLQISYIRSLCKPCVKNPLSESFYVLSKLKMHLLPVAYCEWSTIDIMRGSEQHTCMCELATHICSKLRAYFYHSIADVLSLIQNASYPQYDRLSLWAGKNRLTMGNICRFGFSWEWAAAFCKYKYAFLSVCIHLCVWVLARVHAWVFVCVFE